VVRQFREGNMKSPSVARGLAYAVILAVIAWTAVRALGARTAVQAMTARITA
jgi:hypothetical protein